MKRQKERVKGGERTSPLERVRTAESIKGPERAMSPESTMARERARPIESTIVVERPEPSARQRRLLIRSNVAAMPKSQQQARFLVDLYYQLQDFRKASGNELGAAGRAGEAAPWVEDIHGGLQKVENRVKTYLEEFAAAVPVGRWAASVTGIGPVISAGLLAHIDIHKAPTAGHVWRFAGLDPTQHWLGAERGKQAVAEALREHSLTEAIPLVAERIGCKAETLSRLATSDISGKPIDLTAASLAKAAAKRPWNAKLKVLCWHIGECFVRTSNHPTAYYGHLWAARKADEEGRNERGDFAEQAKAALQAKRIGKDTEAYKWYSQGKLPPAHIHARAKRYAVKLFLSHWHWVAYESEFGELPPKPYVIEHLGHADLLRPPGWEPDHQ